MCAAVKVTPTKLHALFHLKIEISVKLEIQCYAGFGKKLEILLRVW